MNLLRSYEKRLQQFRTMVNDPDAMTLNEAKLANMSRIHHKLSVEEDRLKEFAAFYDLTEAEAQNTQSVEHKDKLHDLFDSVETDQGLLQNYRNARLFYTARMQLAYTRFPVAYKLLRYFNALYPKKKRRAVRVLDYGCGVGDYGLAFALHGYSVTLLDIEGGNLDFAKWRFEKRSLPHQVIAANEENLYPSLGEQTIVLSGEVLEHVRDPLTVLKNTKNCLMPGGYFWYSGYPDYEREVGGDHLQEAADVRLEALDYVMQHFKPATRLQLPGTLMKKR
ncbi:MAG: class I SAM-dependent methyltransferase [Cyanobacteria bacterium P01_H01_bin.74]